MFPTSSHRRFNHCAHDVQRSYAFPKLKTFEFVNLATAKYWGYLPITRVAPRRAIPSTEGIAAPPETANESWMPCCMAGAAPLSDLS